MSAIRKFMGLGPRGASLADQAEAESNNALRDVTESIKSYRETNQTLVETHKELRKTVTSFEPFLEAERLMKEGVDRRNGFRYRP
jgi:hypothetical protein